MSRKIVVAKSGYNALTETDSDNLSFSSDFNTLKYYSQGTITVTTNKANYYKSVVDEFLGTIYYHYTVEKVTHNLGYVPYFAGYILDTPTASTACQAPYAFGDAVVLVYLAVFADDTYLYFVVHFNSIDNSGTIDTDFSYRIFKNNLGL